MVAVTNLGMLFVFFCHYNPLVSVIAAFHFYFRFSLFLHGIHVSRVSVLVLQQLGMTSPLFMTPIYMHDSSPPPPYASPPLTLMQFLVRKILTINIFSTNIYQQINIKLFFYYYLVHNYSSILLCTAVKFTMQC